MKKNTLLLLIITTMLSCNDEKNSETATIVPDTIPPKVEVAFETAKEIFYSLPSPVETAMIIENTNLQFTDEFLLPTDAVNLYETSYEQALNLGIYSADLSYLTMFGQQQMSVKYLATCKKLADDLNLLNAISDSTIDKLQNNIMDRDQAMSIISEQFININSYLEENDQSINATLIVFGGWIEGLYLSTKLAETNNTNPQLTELIYDQNISLEDLIILLEMYEKDKQINTYLSELIDLRNIYNNISTPPEQKDFKNINTKVQNIRNSLTKTS